MNELNVQTVSNCFNYENNKTNNKRSLNSNEYESKRIRNNDNEININYEEIEDTEEMNEYDRSLLDLSNRLTNFSINFIDIPEWPEIVPNHNIDPVQSHKNWLKKIKKTPKYPPLVGQTFFGYCLDVLVKLEKRYAIFFGHKVNDNTSGQIVVKIAIEFGVHQLNFEINNYKHLRDCRTVPELKDSLEWKDYKSSYMAHTWGLIVTEKLGPNLIEIMPKISGSRLEMIGNFSVQILDLIEQIHDKGLIHCNLKPENFVLESESSLKLKIIGLSSARKYMIKKSDGTYEHIKYQTDKKVPKGDPNFHSIGYHNGVRRSRRDDMESIGYCLVYFMNGSLPWIQNNEQYIKNQSPKSSSKTIKSIGISMQNTTISTLCEGLSQGFFDYFQLISQLSFKDRPDYEALRNCFRNGD